ncbi:S1 family peptidase [Vibrio sp.]|uniref:S1 family peptidase n=1 Tax=Vibrio sp. TaxID=678 RepID=UPI003D141BD4
MASLLMPAYSQASNVEVSAYIVNGNPVDINNYPSFASLFLRNGDLYSTTAFCGATMINSEYALTAAHCLHDSSQPDTVGMLYMVVAPQLSDEQNFIGSQQARASEFYYPDNYVHSAGALYANDIAIIKLEQPIGAQNFQYVLNFETNNNYPSDGEYKAVGHGLISSEYADTYEDNNSQLLETDLTIVGQAACQTVFGSNVTDKQICFDGAEGPEYKNATCFGDSGGPVYWYEGGQYKQIGITSFGPGICGNPNLGVTSVFTEIADYQDWIMNVINGMEVPKHKVLTQNGTRVLWSDSDPSTDTDTGSDNSNNVQPQSSGGGSLGIIGGLMLLILARWRRVH